MPEDRRIAIVALVVTGVVGLGAPLIAVVASRDSQREAFREERVQADIAELRSALDDATAGISTLLAGAVDAGDAWPKRGRQKRRAWSAFLRDVERTRRHYYRLRLRLGDGDKAVSEYEKVYLTSTDLLYAMEGPATRRREEKATELYEEIRGHRESFIAAAQQLARSRLD